VTYLDFKQSLENWVRANYTNPDDFLQKIDWNAWVHQPGANPPNNGLDFKTEGAQNFENLADMYIAGNGLTRPDNYTAYLNTTDPQL